VVERDGVKLDAEADRGVEIAAPPRAQQGWLSSLLSRKLLTA